MQYVSNCTRVLLLPLKNAARWNFSLRGSIAKTARTLMHQEQLFTALLTGGFCFSRFLFLSVASDTLSRKVFIATSNHPHLFTQETNSCKPMQHNLDYAVPRTRHARNKANRPPKHHEATGGVACESHLEDNHKSWFIAGC